MQLGKKLLAAVMVVLMVATLLPTALAAEGEKHLVIIGTSDTHGNIWGYSYEDMKESQKDGLARISTYVNQVREENPNTILVDTGDSIQGTIMTDDLYSKSAEQHPVMAAMNYMKYDAWTLGNHEFNWGVDNLKAVMAQSNAPVLAANIKNADGSCFTGSAYTIVERDGVKVAIIGVDTPNIPRWDGTKQGVSDLTFEPMAGAVKEAIEEIGDQADVIMVCAHAGLEAEYSSDGADAAQTILDQNPEVDLIQLGHTHTTYINNDGVPIGEAKNNAGEVLRYNLTLDADNHLTSAVVETVSMEGIVPDEGLRGVAEIKAAQEKTVEFITGNVLGHASADFQPADEIKGIPAGRIQDTAVIDLIAAVQLENSGADVTGVALFKDTSNLKQGDLNYGNLFDIYKYPNVLYTVKVTGAEMKAYMEWAAECWNQWQPGDVSISFNPDKAGYLHDHFAGLNYEVNLSKPAGERIENIVFQGQPLKEDQVLTLCVNDYRFSGLKTAGILHGEKEWESSASVRDMLVAYLAEHDPLEPVVDNNWKITGVDLQLDRPERAELIAKVNSGELETPYNESLKLSEAPAEPGPEPQAVIVDTTRCSTVTAEDGTIYYRLRDLAAELDGTSAAFNVKWDGKVVVTRGERYTALDLSQPNLSSAVPSEESFSVDGEMIHLPVLYVAAGDSSRGGYHYISAEGLALLLGVTATEAGGALTIVGK